MAILIIALIAAIAFAVMQRRPGGTRVAPPSRPAGRRARGSARRDPMEAAVAEHAQATEPAEVLVAEQRLRGEARQVAAGLEADARRTEDQRMADAVDGRGAHVMDPALESYEQPAADPNYDDPRTDDRRR